MPINPGPTVLYVPDWRVQDAISAGMDVYDLLINNWGSQLTTCQYPNPSVSTDTPNGATVRGLPVSPAGVAIGPRSTVNRAFLSWSLQKIFNPNGDNSEAPRLVRQVSLGSPLLYQQPADIKVGMANGTLDEDMLYGSCFIGASPLATSGIPGGAILPPQLVNGVGTVVNFGGRYIDTAANPLLLPQFLHLVLYLRAPLVSPPTARLPYHIYTGSVAASLTAGTEQAIAFIPTSGRKSIKLLMRTGTGGASAFRVGVIPSLDTSIAYEATEITGGAVAANATTQIHITDLCADYVNVWFTPTVTGTYGLPSLVGVAID